MTPEDIKDPKRKPEPNSLEFETLLPRVGADARKKQKAAENAPADPEELRKKPQSKQGSLTLEPRASLKIPDTVTEQFTRLANDLYFPDGEKAITVYDNKVTAHSENTVVIQSAAAIAAASAPGAIVIKGSDNFKAQAWLALQSMGAQTKGYEPTDADRQRLSQTLAQRIAQERSAKAAAQHGPLAPTGAKEGQLITGRLTEHRARRYLNQENGSMSYYVRLSTDSGPVEQWGADLERAIRKSLSSPKVGDEVGIRIVGQEKVPVLKARIDAHGRQIGKEEKLVNRYHWIVETKEFLDRRRDMAAVFRDETVPAAQAKKEFPEMTGTYQHLELAEDHARRSFPTKQGREDFINRTRAVLAQDVEYGRPLAPQMLLKAKEPRTANPERDLVPGH